MVASSRPRWHYSGAVLETQAKAAGPGNVFETAMGRAERATRRATEAIDSQIGSLSSLTEAARKARNAADLSVLGKNISNGDGSATGQLDVPEGSTFDQRAFDLAQRLHPPGGCPGAGCWHVRYRIQSGRQVDPGDRPDADRSAIAGA